MDLGIAGRKAIVCASSAGLGRACALELARAGVDVVVNGRDAAKLKATADAIRAETGIATQLSTTGGTSDGRFIARICREVLECGPPNAMIHKIDEHIEVAELEPLKNIYRRTIENLAGSAA